MNKLSKQEMAELKADFWGYLVLPAFFVIMSWGAWELYHLIQPA